jgi:hypothetical protein
MEDEMGGTHGGVEKWIQNFSLKTWMEEATWETYE